MEQRREKNVHSTLQSLPSSQFWFLPANSLKFLTSLYHHFWHLKMLSVEKRQGINIYWSVWHYLVPGSTLTTIHMWPHSSGAFRIFSPPFTPFQSQGKRSLCPRSSSHCCIKPEGKLQVMPKVMARTLGFRGWGRSEMEGRNRKGTRDSFNGHYRKWAPWQVPRCLCVLDRPWTEWVKSIWKAWDKRDEFFGLLNVGPSLAFHISCVMSRKFTQNYLSNQSQIYGRSNFLSIIRYWKITRNREDIEREVRNEYHHEGEGRGWLSGCCHSTLTFLLRASHALRRDKKATNSTSVTTFPLVFNLKWLSIF